MIKMLISGYYGFDNAGDEAILQTMIAQFKDMEKPVDITVLSNTPELTAKQHDVKAVNRNKLSKIIRAIWQTDILISGGGSLLQEATGRLSNYYYLAMYVIAKLFDKQVIVYSHGVGPIYSKTSKRLISFLFNRVALVSVRDDRSKDELISYGVKGDKILVTSDPVLSYDQLANKGPSHVLEGYAGYHAEWPTIGFALKNAKDRCLSDDFVKIIESLKQTPCNIVLIPFHYHQDMALLKAIQEKTSQDVILIEKKQSVDEVFEIINELDLLLGVRLHALIFAAVTKTPLVGISYDPKIDAFLNMMEEKPICTIDAIDVESIVKQIGVYLEDKDERSETLQRRVSHYRQLLQKYNEQIGNLLDKR